MEKPPIKHVVVKEVCDLLVSYARTVPHYAMRARLFADIAALRTDTSPSRQFRASGAVSRPGMTTMTFGTYDEFAERDEQSAHFKQ